MAKKQNTKAAGVDAEKVAFQVRFDRDLHEELVKLGAESGISLNQLVQGICRGAMAAANVGSWDQFGMKQGDKPYKFVTSRSGNGCVWFGKKGEFDESQGEPISSGEFWFGIDVRERGDVHVG